MKYYVCGYCGKAKRGLFKKPRRCGCSGGGGKTFMTKHPKTAYKRWKANVKATKKFEKGKK